jgi:hypothetical protein
MGEVFFPQGVFPPHLEMSCYGVFGRVRIYWLFLNL